MRIKNIKEGHDDEQNGITEGGVPPSTQEGRKGKSIGRELEKENQALNSRIPIHVADGKRRPEAPLQAANLASEVK
ncbi:hypothetical protein GUJ93_ZPchr0010g7332 [Zizania palustris]|uniref:Uncharacterized protein n=1 Tax=Zizania palustris TaxID=103762 RepID=A0A8J5WD63_ZIZPA|nr:hypothetical protein GUJ93_ZPchr0010g7332 [Zizania palustris]